MHADDAAAREPFGTREPHELLQQSFPGSGIGKAGDERSLVDRERERRQDQVAQPIERQQRNLHPEHVAGLAASARGQNLQLDRKQQNEHQA